MWEDLWVAKVFRLPHPRYMFWRWLCLSLLLKSMQAATRNTPTWVYIPIQCEETGTRPWLPARIIWVPLEQWNGTVNRFLDPVRTLFLLWVVSSVNRYELNPKWKELFPEHSKCSAINSSLQAPGKPECVPGISMLAVYGATDKWGHTSVGCSCWQILPEQPWWLGILGRLE